jgi:hypothetical protein
MTSEYLLYLPWVNVVGAGVNHLVGPTHDMEVAQRVLHR